MSFYPDFFQLDKTPFSLSELRRAYLKLKSYAYWDNTLLWLKFQIAEFESAGVESKLRMLAAILRNRNVSRINDLILEVDQIQLPKSLSNPQSNIFTNLPPKSTILEGCATFARIPLELMILDVLWIMRFGLKLQSPYWSHAYGFRLESEIVRGVPRIKGGLKLFEPYFQNYQRWTENALKTVDENLLRMKRVALITFDISSFYHSIDLDLDRVNEDLFGLDEQPDHLRFLHSVWESILRGYKQRQGSTNQLLPIGLLSSGIIANYYLKEFDNGVRSTLYPSYYGRYVDDIAIVFEPARDREFADLNEVIDHHFVQTNLLIKHEDGNLALAGYHGLTMSLEKSKLFLLYASGRNTVLDKLRDTLSKNRSLMQVLPEDALYGQRISEAIDVSSSAQARKLRDISNSDIDKYQLSLWLNQEIDLALLSSNYRVPHDELLGVLSPSTVLQYYLLWPRICALYVCAEDTRQLLQFCDHIIQALRTLRSDSIRVEEIHKSLLMMLHSSLALALSLDLDFHGQISRLPSPDNTQDIGTFLIPSVHEVELIRNSSMYRHRYLANPIITYLNIELPRNLIKAGFSMPLVNGSSIFSFRRTLYSPRFIQWHELYLPLQLQAINTDHDAVNLDGLEVRCQREYIRANFRGRYRRSTVSWLKTLIPFGVSTETSVRRLTFGGRLIEVSDKESVDAGRFRIAIGNTRISLNDIESAIQGSPNLAISRLYELHRMLNAARRQRASIIVLPEVFVPPQWITHLVKYSKEHQILIIAGLEHLRVNDTVYNYSIACVPQRTGAMKFAFPILQLKKHYSPEETKLIGSHSGKVPFNAGHVFNVIGLPNIALGVYNCFDIANIENRLVYAHRVDLIAIVECNRDTRYFGSIVEALSRDLHCFVTQVNDATWGDSRIIAPVNHEARDYVRVKGGDNRTVLTEIIEVNELRAFQRGSTKLPTGRGNAEFKPLPPKFHRRF